MANDMTLFKAAGLSLANIGKYKEALARVQASAPARGGDDILRLDKEGVWRYGQELTEIEPGSLWAANPLTFAKGYVAWQKGVNKPLGKMLKNILDQDNRVDPNMLPDVGGTWSESVEVQFMCTNGEDKGKLVKFTSNSSGGVERWHELVAQLSHQFDVDPTRLVPVVSLEHDGYFHNDQSFGVRHPETKKPGWIVKPIFRVVEWLKLDGTTDEQLTGAANGHDTDAEQAPQQSTSSRRQSTIQDNPAPEPARSTRRASTITSAQADAVATTMTGMPSEPSPDPVVRRRRRAT